MQTSRLFSSVLILGLAFLIGCGGGSSTPPNTPPATPPGSAAVSLTIQDMPPMGVTVLSFEVTITGAVMQPGNVSMISAPVRLEMKRLEVLKSFLNTVNVPAGTYTSMSVTLANPRMTVLNNSGMGMMGGCAAGTVCEVVPPMMASSVNITGAPFPLTVQDNTPLGMLLDFDLLNSIQSNMSVNPIMSCSRRSPMQGTGQLDEIEDVLGRVTAKDAANNQFSLQVMHGAQTIAVKVDANTRF